MKKLLLIALVFAAAAKAQNPNEPVQVNSDPTGNACNYYSKFLKYNGNLYGCPNNATYQQLTSGGASSGLQPNGTAGIVYSPGTGSGTSAATVTNLATLAASDTAGTILLPSLTYANTSLTGGSVISQATFDSARALAIQYGATGNNSTDDTAALTAMMHDCGNVYPVLDLLPFATYFVSDNITFLTTRGPCQVNFNGATIRSTSSSTSNAVFVMPSGTNNVTFQGPGVIQGGNRAAISWSSGTGLVVRNIVFTGETGVGKPSIYIGILDRGVIDGNTFINNANGGLLVATSLTNTSITNNYAQNIGYADNNRTNYQDFVYVANAQTQLASTSGGSGNIFSFNRVVPNSSGVGLYRYLFEAQSNGGYNNEQHWTLESNTATGIPGGISLALGNTATQLNSANVVGNHLCFDPQCLPPIVPNVPGSIRIGSGATELQLVATSNTLSPNNQVPLQLSILAPSGTIGSISSTFNTASVNNQTVRQLIITPTSTSGVSTMTVSALITYLQGQTTIMQYLTPLTTGNGTGIVPTVAALTTTPTTTYQFFNAPGFIDVQGSFCGIEAATTNGNYVNNTVEGFSPNFCFETNNQTFTNNNAFYGGQGGEFQTNNPQNNTVLNGFNIYNPQTNGITQNTKQLAGSDLRDTSITLNPAAYWTSQQTPTVSIGTGNSQISFTSIISNPGTYAPPTITIGGSFAVSGTCAAMTINFPASTTVAAGIALLQPNTTFNSCFAPSTTGNGSGTLTAATAITATITGASKTSNAGAGTGMVLTFASNPFTPGAQIAITGSSVAAYNTTCVVSPVAALTTSTTVTCPGVDSSGFAAFTGTATATQQMSIYGVSPVTSLYGLSIDSSNGSWDVFTTNIQETLPPSMGNGTLFVYGMQVNSSYSAGTVPTIIDGNSFQSNVLSSGANVRMYGINQNSNNLLQNGFRIRNTFLTNLYQDISGTLSQSIDILGTVAVGLTNTTRWFSGAELIQGEGAAIVSASTIAITNAAHPISGSTTFNTITALTPSNKPGLQVTLINTTSTPVSFGITGNISSAGQIGALASTTFTWEQAAGKWTASVLPLGPATITSSATPAFNFSLGALQNLTLSANVTSVTTTGPAVIIPYAAYHICQPAAVAVTTTSATTPITSGSPTFTVASTTGIVNGQYVIGAGIPVGTTITISGSTITMSQNATANESTGTTVSFGALYTWNITKPANMHAWFTPFPTTVTSTAFAQCSDIAGSWNGTDFYASSGGITQQ